MMKNQVYLEALGLSREQAIQNYAYLVDKIAHRLIMRLPANIELDDLKSVGMIGLIDSIEKYSDDKGSHFKVYAEIRIRGSIMDELRALDWVPRSVRECKSLIHKTQNKLSQELGRVPTAEEMAQELNLDITDYQNLKSKANVKSIISYEDLNTRSESPRDILESIPDHQQLDPESIQEKQDELTFIHKALRQLPDRPRMVLSLYYLEEMKLKDIGSLLGVSESRVSQIQSQAIKLIKPILKKLRAGD
jgi:RNA polymerase sigma factor FliA